MTHVPKDTHPWNSLHPEDRFPESRGGGWGHAAGQQSPHLDLGGTLEASTEEETLPTPHVHRGLVQTVLKDVVSSPSV